MPENRTTYADPSASEQLCSKAEDLTGPLPLTFPIGLPGFSQYHSFALESVGPEGCYWLRCKETGGPTFLVVDPSIFAPRRRLLLPPELPALMQARELRQLRILAIVTLPREPGEAPTMNLQGLVAINPALGLARQVIVPESGHGVRSRLDRSLPLEAA